LEFGTIAYTGPPINLLKNRIIFRLVQVLALISFIGSGLAQEISIPDPGLNAAVRFALQKPTRPLTETDLLSLTSLIANSQNVSNTAGLENALNLTSL
jgi:hypothetical protein